MLARKYFDREVVVSDSENNRSGNYSNPWRLCSVSQMEELKILIPMLLIWSSGIIFSAVYAQMSTLFLEQGTMMDTNVSSFELSLASLSSRMQIGSPEVVQFQADRNVTEQCDTLSPMDTVSEIPTNSQLGTEYPTHSSLSNGMGIGIKTY